MNSSLKYFFNRCFEILHPQSFDSYRLSLNNPYIIFDELNAVVQKYTKKKVKHFDPTVVEVGNEALDFLTNDHLKDLLKFEPFSKNQVVGILNDSCVKSKNDKKIRSLGLISKTIIASNSNFKKAVFDRIMEIIEEDDSANYQELNSLCGWYLSQLQHLGFSRVFVESRIRKCRDSIFQGGNTAQASLTRLSGIFDLNSQDYFVFFKLKKQPEQLLKFASTKIKETNKLPKHLEDSIYLNSKFKEKTNDEIFVRVAVSQHDFWSSVIDAHQLLSASIEINTLHDSSNKILIETQAVTVHKFSKKMRVETIEQEVDGHYLHNDVEFTRFVNNLKAIESDTAREKISSAIRFYKLGNESIEMEHKILNYWIGFEQLFSAVDSNEDSINRMKTFYTSLNISFYFQRRANYLISSLERNHIKYKSRRITNAIFNGTLDKTKLSGTNPLLLERLELYFKLNDNKEIRKYIELHAKRLNQHLTRIYRVRNELVHEGKSAMNVKLMAGHLRHYLLFTIEQVTNEIAENPTVDKLDDVFVYFENIKERIKSCNSINEIVNLKSYRGYME